MNKIQNVFKLTEIFIFYTWFCSHFNLYVDLGWNILKVYSSELSSQCLIPFKSVVFKQRRCEKHASLHILNRVNTGRSKICFGFHSLRVSSLSHQNHKNNFGNSAISIESKFFHINQISWTCIYMFDRIFFNPQQFRKILYNWNFISVCPEVGPFCVLIRIPQPKVNANANKVLGINHNFITSL